MAEGQEIDSRGLYTAKAAAEIRKLRADEAYSIYDSIIIGEGANTIDNGWYDTWSDFEAANDLTWFGGRSSNAGRAYSNQTSERRDWAFDIYQFHVEYTVVSPFSREWMTDVTDAQIMPEFFMHSLPHTMAFKVKLAQSDDMLEIPGMAAPAGGGRVGNVVSDAVDQIYNPGSLGQPHVSNAYKFPTPIMVPANGQIVVSSRLTQPIKQYLQNLTASPGAVNLPNGAAGGVTRVPIWYVIRLRFDGNRFLQLRGARSAAGAATG